MKKREQVITFLGKGTEFEGKLTFHGTIRIDGHFKGEIAAGGNLIVGEEGLVEADVQVGYIDISGEVHGNIVAEQRVEIRAPGKVFGDIQAPSVVIGEGVIFEGKTQMYQAKQIADVGEEMPPPEENPEEPMPNLGTIYGIVTDRHTGTPLKNAMIRCKGPGKKTTETNAAGYYELPNLKDGEWKVEVKAKGYKKDTALVRVISGGKYEQNFE
jgi:cytoskeletal protein CcmA (bactofilin family)